MPRFIAVSTVPAGDAFDPEAVALWAQYAKERYDKVMAWFSDQHLAVQAIGALFTFLVVVGTLWLLGAVDWTAELFGIDWPWLNSPIGLGA